MWNDFSFEAQDIERLLKVYETETHPGRLADALCGLGWAYVDGEAVCENFETAATWFERAALLGDVQSVTALSAMYERGLGVPLDLSKALSLLRQAAQLNSPEAWSHLGWCYFAGNHAVPKDDDQAYSCFEHAADLGDAGAESNCQILARILDGDFAKPTNEDQRLMTVLGFRTAEALHIWLNVAQPVADRLTAHRSKEVYPDDEPDLDLTFPPPEP